LAVIDIYVSIAKKSAVAVAAEETVPAEEAAEEADTVEEAATEDPDMTGVKPQPDKRKARKTSITPIRYFEVTASADTENCLQVISGFLLKNTAKYPRYHIRFRPKNHARTMLPGPFDDFYHIYNEI